ncbi:MAG: hypothetical protein U9R51_04210 [Actinomycetota bacterium]|nr:hypothetical protein [Actinomycetota bacterium]
MTDRDDLLRRVTIANPFPADVELSDDLGDSRPPVTLLVDGGGSTVAPQSTRNTSRWRGPAIAAAAALVIVVAVSVPLLLGGGQDGAPTAGTTPTTIPATTAAPPPPTTVAPTTVPPIAPTTPMTWTRLIDSAAFGGDDGIRVMMDVATGDDVAIAVGADGADGGLFFDAAVWYSTDGLTWNRVPHDDEVFGGDGHQRMNAVVSHESGFIAVGSEGDEPGAPGGAHPDFSLSGPSETHAAVWLSDDGVTWTRVPHADSFSESNGGAVMNDVLFDGSGFVAVGLAYQQVPSFATYRWGTGAPSAPTDVDIDVDAAVWRSVDGIAWTRVVSDDMAFGGDTVRQSMRAITAGGPGFVAVGQEGFDFLGFDEWTPIPRNNPVGSDHVTDNVAAVWTSPDGEIWTRVTGAPSLAHGGGAVAGWATMFDVATNGPNLIAVGRDVWVLDGSGTSVRVREGAAVWLSPHGLTWQRVDVQDMFSGPDMHAVMSTSDGNLVAGGGHFIYDSAGAWTSRDEGDTWVKHPNEDGLFSSATIQGLATFGGSVLAVGTFDDDASVWIGMWSETDE